MVGIDVPVAARGDRGSQQRLAALAGPFGYRGHQGWTCWAPITGGSCERLVVRVVGIDVIGRRVAIGATVTTAPAPAPTASRRARADQVGADIDEAAGDTRVVGIDVLDGALRSVQSGTTAPALTPATCVYSEGGTWTQLAPTLGEAAVDGFGHSVDVLDGTRGDRR